MQKDSSAPRLARTSRSGFAVRCGTPPQRARQSAARGLCGGGTGPVHWGSEETWTAGTDGLRLDILARAVATWASWRLVLKGIAAGMVPAALRFTHTGFPKAQDPEPHGVQCSGLGVYSV